MWCLRDTYKAFLEVREFPETFGRHPWNDAAIQASLKTPHCATADVHLLIGISLSESRPDAAIMCTGSVW
jgi:hypothetical protein